MALEYFLFRAFPPHNKSRLDGIFNAFLMPFNGSNCIISIDAFRLQIIF